MAEKRFNDNPSLPSFTGLEEFAVVKSEDNLDYTFTTNALIAYLNTILTIASIGQVTGLQTALDAKQPLDDTLTALAGLNSTAGVVVETSADTFTKRSFADSVDLQWTNPAGVAGNFSSVLTATGITSGNYGAQAQTLLLQADTKGRITGISAVSIQIPESAVTDLVTDLAAKLALSGGTMTGDLILNADATQALQPVTFQQFAAMVAGLSYKNACVVATTANLTATYSNGASGVGATLTNSGVQAALSIDGVSLSVNDRVLVKNQSTPAQNGIYRVTTVGSGAVNWELTRATDYDTTAEITTGSYTNITAGTVNSGVLYFQSTSGSITVGTTAIAFSVLAIIIAGAGLVSTAPNTLAVNFASGAEAIAGTVSDKPIAPDTLKAKLGTQTNHGLLVGAGQTSAFTALAVGSTGQVLMGATGADPVFSAATYPSTTTINRILFSSANNTVSEIATVNNAVLTTDSSGVPSFTTPTHIIVWNDVTGTSQTMSVNNGYLADNAALVTLTLPSTAAQFSTVEVCGNGAGGWKIAQNSGQIIKFGSQSSTSGTGGFIASTNQYDVVKLMCVVANTTWVVLSSIGNITIT